jgi:hypothetical protein
VRRGHHSLSALPHAFGVVAAMLTITTLILAIIYAVTYRLY